jgi:hypothetical protein
MKLLLALFLSLHAQARPQDVYVDLSKPETILRIEPSAIDATGIDFSFRVNIANTGNTPITLENLEFFVNGQSAAYISLQRPLITLQRLDSHTIRLMGMRYSLQNKPKNFLFILHGTGSRGQEILRSSKLSIE